ncbi:hypothetical protein MU582_06740 [Nocardioidaceae bacterium SCSIO 66511]|nr:hypothetical protein MU582_06740 [Nocardioidaceae bacterium SCSIO 66511]
MMSGRANVDLYLDATDSRCYTYDDLPPILEVRTATVVLSLTPPDVRVVTDADVAASRELLTAVQRYAFAVGRRYAEQNDIPVAHVNGPNDPAVAEAVA